MGFYDDNKVKQNKPVSAVPVINETPHVVPDKEPTIISPDEQLIDRKYVLNTQNNLTGVSCSRVTPKARPSRSRTTRSITLSRTGRASSTTPSTRCILFTSPCLRSTAWNSG